MSRPCGAAGQSRLLPDKPWAGAGRTESSGLGGPIRRCPSCGLRPFPGSGCWCRVPATADWSSSSTVTWSGPARSTDSAVRPRRLHAVPREDPGGFCGALRVFSGQGELQPHGPRTAHDEVRGADGLGAEGSRWSGDCMCSDREPAQLSVSPRRFLGYIMEVIRCSSNRPRGSRTLL
jgi:hypothetical protein